ncbi:hypothetical protein [Novosphingobium jiangmenense]|uniref:Lipoprotein n=1 Tax=Novosphingobium jiangmenense TaxID=2791981 RepID=A0ABS0HIN3_9SPHN|nr:hypothetical protein [Novosphingobium jiangmenense]MBF9151854.1 hypothetical protein [Novosphingobium jiangmenense]
MSQMPKPATFRLLGALALPFALMIGACDAADKPTQPMDAKDVPENQGMGGAYDGNPTGTPSGTGADTAVNAPAEDRSAADGTTPMQTQQQ